MPTIGFTDAEIKALLNVVTGAKMKVDDNIRDYEAQVEKYAGHNEGCAEVYREIVADETKTADALGSALEKIDNAHERGRRKIATARRR